jgi:hypothetical protein
MLLTAFHGVYGYMVWLGLLLLYRLALAGAECTGKPIVYNSYIQFLLHEITGYTPDAHKTDITVAVVLLFVYAFSNPQYQRQHSQKKSINIMPC